LPSARRSKRPGPQLQLLMTWPTQNDLRKRKTRIKGIAKQQRVGKQANRPPRWPWLRSLSR
jgi:hypothetical protein